MSDWVTVNEGDDYYTRARRCGTYTTKIVIVEWHHPNMGWQDAGVFVRFSHSLSGINGWELLHSASWLDDTDAAEFVDQFPKFKKLFRD